jgi:hypothetical protein
MARKPCTLFIVVFMFWILLRPSGPKMYGADTCVSLRNQRGIFLTWPLAWHYLHQLDHLY